MAARAHGQSAASEDLGVKKAPWESRSVRGSLLDASHNGLAKHIAQIEEGVGRIVTVGAMESVMVPGGGPSYDSGDESEDASLAGWNGAPGRARHAEMQIMLQPQALHDDGGRAEALHDDGGRAKALHDDGGRAKALHDDGRRAE
eukprot:gene1418-2022_t